MSRRFKMHVQDPFSDKVIGSGSREDSRKSLFNFSFGSNKRQGLRSVSASGLRPINIQLSSSDDGDDIDDDTPMTSSVAKKKRLIKYIKHEIETEKEITDPSPPLPKKFKSKRSGKRDKDDIATTVMNAQPVREEEEAMEVDGWVTNLTYVVMVDDAVCETGSDYEFVVFEAKFVVEEKRMEEYMTLQNSDLTKNELVVNDEGLTQNCAKLLQPTFSQDNQEYPGVRMNVNPINGKFAIGYLEIKPRTVFPFETWPDRDITYTIIKGKMVVKSAGAFTRMRDADNKNNYLFGKEFGVGATVMVLRNTIYSLENWEKEDLLLYCSMMRD